MEKRGVEYREKKGKTSSDLALVSLDVVCRIVHDAVRNGDNRGAKGRSGGVRTDIRGRTGN